MTVPAAKPPKLLSESAVRQVLRERYTPPAWAFLPQLRNGTGYSRRARTADAVAMSLYPSRGLDLHGFEIKTCRNDWLRELADPEKAEAICSYCNRWWIVVGDAKIVAPGELPPTWGLLIPHGPGLLAKVEAPKLKPNPLDHLLLASILRKAQEVSVTDSEIAMAVRRALEDSSKRHAEEIEIRTARLREELQEERRKIYAFEQESGISIGGHHVWSPPGTMSVAEAVRFVLAGGVEKQRAELDAVREKAVRVLAGIDAVLAPAAPAPAIEEAS